MTEEKYTRCPSCKTVFRVTDAQLALRDGMVRCGHCHTIFDGPEAMISLAPAAAGDENVNDEALLGPPTVTLRSSRALEPAPQERGEPSVQIEPRLMQDEHDAEPVFASTETAIVDEDADDEAPRVDYANRFAWDKPKVQRPRRPLLYASACVLLVLLLAVQVLYHFRDAIAAHWPATRPALAGMCATLGCSVLPLRDVGALSIDASDLQVDPAHKGLLILTATVRNRAAYTLAYPHLELTLTDGQDQVVVRRAFPPAEYLGGTVDVRSGLAGNGEAALKLFIDASATTQAGYRLYLFYP